MIKISGAMNRLSALELERDRAFYAENEWKFPEDLSHTVKIQIPIAQIDELCELLKQSRPDEKGIYFFNKETNEKDEIPSVSIRLKGAEMTGNWTRLWGSVSAQAEGAGAGIKAPVAPRPPRPAPPAPVRLGGGNKFAAPAAAAPAGAPPAAPGWAAAPAPIDTQEDIPF
jgi:hypothetical protein